MRHGGGERCAGGAMRAGVGGVVFVAGFAGVLWLGGCAAYTTQSGAFAHETVRVTAESPVASEGSVVAGVRLAAESR